VLASSSKAVAWAFAHNLASTHAWARVAAGKLICTDAVDIQEVLKLFHIGEI